MSQDSGERADNPVPGVLGTMTGTNGFGAVNSRSSACCSPESSGATNSSGAVAMWSGRVIGRTRSDEAAARCAMEVVTCHRHGLHRNWPQNQPESLEPTTTFQFLTGWGCHRCAPCSFGTTAATGGPPTVRWRWRRAAAQQASTNNRPPAPAPSLCLPAASASLSPSAPASGQPARRFAQRIAGVFPGQGLVHSRRKRESIQLPRR